MTRPDLIQPYTVTLTADGLYIDGHRGIEIYTTETIAVKLKKKLITVTGRRLTLGAMTKRELVITGVVQNIEVTDRGRQL